MSRQRFVIKSSGYTLTEVLVVIALIGIAVTIVVGINFSATRKQKALIYAARQFSADMQNAVQQARARCSEVILEINTTQYLIYKESGSTPAGFQEGDELLLKRILNEGITVVEPTDSYPPLPQAWGNPDSSTDITPAGNGASLRFTGRGTLEEKAVIFYLSSAPSYQHVCVHVLVSGESEIVRSADGSTWTTAPAG